jgi:hypothetical protein
VASNPAQKSADACGLQPIWYTFFVSSLVPSARLARIQLHHIKSLAPFDLLLAIVLGALACYFGSNIFSPVRFDREKIEIWAADGQIQVHGLYHYRNRFPLPISFSLGLPFPVDVMHPVPSTFSIAELSANGSDSKDIAPRNYHGGIVFRLWFAPREEKWISVDYIQGAFQPSGRYILTTTSKWKQPIDQGEYVLHLAAAEELAASNYALQKDLSGPAKEYSFSRSNFYPVADWTFSWEPPAPQITSKRIEQ